MLDDSAERVRVITATVVATLQRDRVAITDSPAIDLGTGMTVSRASLSLLLSLSPTHTHTLSLSPTHTHSLSLSHTLSLSLPHTLSLSPKTAIQEDKVGALCCINPKP